MDPEREWPGRPDWANGNICKLLAASQLSPDAVEHTGEWVIEQGVFFPDAAQPFRDQVLDIKDLVYMRTKFEKRTARALYAKPDALIPVLTSEVTECP